jgi:hypothetical protein
MSLLLRCADLTRTRTFYSSVLGFAVHETAESTLTASIDSTRLIFTDQNLWHAEPAFSGTIYIALPDVEHYYALVHDKVDLRWPLHHSDYGTREFGIRDCNGYCLAFSAAGPLTIGDTRRSLRVQHCDLSDSAFHHTRLAAARFDNVDLRGASFHDVGLSGAAFANVDLSDASIADANIAGMKIDGIPVAELLAAYHDR